MSESEHSQNPVTPHQRDSSPPEEGAADQRQFEKVVSQFAGMVMRGPTRSQLVDKFDDQHLHKIIDNTEEDSKREHNRETLGLWLVAGLLLTTIIAVLVLCWVFLSFDKADSLDAILALIFGFISGGLGGYGFGRNKSDK